MESSSEQAQDVEIYTSKNGSVEIRVRTDGQNVWLNRQQLASLFNRDVKTIGKHISNALQEELSGLPVVAKFATTALDGKVYQVEHFNIDLVLSVGEQRISNNALAAITLLVAISEPREKELMISLLVRMMSDGETGLQIAA